MDVSYATSLVHLPCNMSLFPDGYAVRGNRPMQLLRPTIPVLVGHIRIVRSNSDSRLFDIPRHLKGVLSLT